MRRLGWIRAVFSNRYSVFGVRYVVATFWIALVALLLVACAGGDVVDETAVSRNLPLQTLAGEEVNLSDYAGNVVLVNFWATWCAPCREEMPELEAFYQAHQDDGFVLLAVNAGESANRAQGYIDEGGYTFPIILDPDGLVEDYFGGVLGMPTTFVLDQQGEVVYQHVGMLDQAILDAEVAPLLP